jgi:hypothetical protein
MTSGMCKTAKNSRGSGVAHLVKKFLAFYGARRLITVQIRASHWTLPWARRIQSTHTHTLFLSKKFLDSDFTHSLGRVKFEYLCDILWHEVHLPGDTQTGGHLRTTHTNEIVAAHHVDVTVVVCDIASRACCSSKCSRAINVLAGENRNVDTDLNYFRKNFHFETDFCHRLPSRSYELSETTGCHFVLETTLIHTF